MIATLSAEQAHLDESVSTCRFAKRVAMIRNQATINEEKDPHLVIKELKHEVKELQEELCVLQGQQLPPDPLTEDQKERCRQLAIEFVSVDLDAGEARRWAVVSCGAAVRTGGRCLEVT